MGTVPAPLQPAAGTVLTHTHTDSWYNTQAFLLRPPSCRVHLAASTDLTAGAVNSIAWTAEDWDIVQAGDTEMHSATVNTDRVTIRTAGRYRVTASVTLHTTAAVSGTYGRIYKNGAFTAGTTPMSWQDLPGSTADYVATFSDEIQCAVGDYLTLGITVPAGATVTARGDEDVHMVVTWISN